jgi:uncharacterized protein (TIGR02466 family)
VNSNEKFAAEIPQEKRGVISGKMSFPTIFYWKDILDYEEKNKEWIKHIRDIKNTNAESRKGVQKSNVFGWQSGNTWITHAGIWNETQTFANELHGAMKIDPEYPAVIDTIWANVNSKGSYNRTHTHSGCHLSFVYYLKCPEKSGQICFSDPRPQAHAVQLPFMPSEHWQGQQPEEYGQEVYWPPTPGRFIMFPSWVCHDVELNQSDQTRISISGNITFRKK